MKVDKLKRRSVLFATASVLLCTGASGQWVQSNGPFGGVVQTLAVSGTDLIAGTFQGGMFLSTDDGGSWTAINQGLTDRGVNCLSVSGGHVFAGTNSGIFHSDNASTGWTPVGEGMANRFVNCLAVSETNVFAGTWNDGVFLSTDNGAHWKSVASGLSNRDVQALAVAGPQSLRRNKKRGFPFDRQWNKLE